MALAIGTAVICFFIGVSLSSGIVVPDGVGSQIYWTFISLLGSAYIAVVVVRNQEYAEARSEIYRVYSKLARHVYSEAEGQRIRFKVDEEERKQLIEEYMACWLFFYYRKYSASARLYQVMDYVRCARDLDGRDAEQFKKLITEGHYYIQNLSLPARGYMPWLIYEKKSPP